MSLVKTLSLAHLPPDLGVHVALYEELQNSRFLRKQLLDGNAEFEYAFVDARMILSEAHILAAVFRAVNDQANDRMKSRNVHSEIVFALSPNNNIAESFRKFGISDQTRSLLVIKVTKDGVDAISKQLEWAVEAKPVEFSDASLERLSDLAEIKKIYKLNAPSKGKTKGPGKDDQVQGEQSDGEGRKEMEMAIIGQMALRGAS